MEPDLLLFIVALSSSQMLNEREHTSRRAQALLRLYVEDKAGGAQGSLAP